MPISHSGREAASATWLRIAAVSACAGVLLLLAAAGVIAAGLNVPWMLAAHASPPGEFAIVAWSSLTVLGLGTSALVVLLAADRRDGGLAALLPLTFAIGGLLTHVPKYLFGEARPAGTAIAGKLHVIGHALSGAVSMPSGHSVTAAAAAALLCAMLARGATARILIALVALLVGCSRVFVGAHWPGDVLAGFGVGLLVAALSLACARARWHEWLAARVASTGGQRVVAVLEVILAGSVLSQDTGYPEGAGMVWLLAIVALASATLRWVATLQRSAAATEARARPS